MESATLMVSKHSNHIITYLTGKSGSEIPDMLPVEKDLSISIAFWLLLKILAMLQAFGVTSPRLIGYWEQPEIHLRLLPEAVWQAWPWWPRSVLCRNCLWCRAPSRHMNCMDFEIHGAQFFSKTTEISCHWSASLHSETLSAYVKSHDLKIHCWRVLSILWCRTDEIWCRLCRLCEYAGVAPLTMTVKVKLSVLKLCAGVSHRI